LVVVPLMFMKASRAPLLAFHAKCIINWRTISWTHSLVIGIRLPGFHVLLTWTHFNVSNDTAMKYKNMMRNVK
jgi:hypothetical protein